MASPWLILLVLSIRGGSTSGVTKNGDCVHGDRDGAASGGDHVNVATGLATAFSPTRNAPSSSLRSSLAAASVERGGRGERGLRRVTMLGDASSDSNVDGDVVVEVAESQSIPVGHGGDDDTPTAATPNAKFSTAENFDEVVNARYACTRFQRYEEPRDGADDDGDNDDKNGTSSSATPAASLSDPSVVRSAYHCLALSRRAPTGFNAQPYRVVLVHSREGKERLARYCLGRNADRVRDSDCTAVFVADRECGRDGRRFAEFLVENMDDANGDKGARRSASRTRRPLSSRALLKLRMLVLLFSSGYPLPRFLSVPISFGVRLGVSVLSFLARRLLSLKRSFPRLSRIFPESVQLLPTLSSAETWSQKNTMLVAMTYMLACTSRGLATCPMEGIDASGARRALGIPRGRYGIPLIVSAGTPYRQQRGVRDGGEEEGEEEEETDDVGLSHGGDGMSPRYPLEEVVYGNAFGKPFLAT